MQKSTGFLFLLLLFSLSSVAQDTNPSVPDDWFLRDPHDDQVQGMSVDKAYRQLLQNRSSKPVIVAVIDSGIDIDHEDLKHSIWTNAGEVPDNGIDDDRNGYIDDVHGWNFIGGEKGNVDQDTNELTREYVRLKNRFEGVDENDVRGKKRTQYEYYKQIKEKFETQFTNNKNRYQSYNEIYRNTVQDVKSIKTLLHTDTLTLEKVEQLDSDDPKTLHVKKILLSIFNHMIGPQGDLNDFLTDLKEAFDHSRKSVEYSYNEAFDPRSIVGDDYSNPYEKKYGNNDVTGGSGAFHGTHVAGIIGANRDNDIGIRGIADNIKIMPLRVVPSGGDERDKDVANAIIYAIKNGAQVINMSFGKSFSPYKKAVDKAVHYAEKKGVLLIHAAGNDSKDIDTHATFPSRHYQRKGKVMNQWLEVGASSWQADKDLVANFSNYGKKEVDVFAPGVRIQSTLPEDQYGPQQGTSMAAPMVTGVAALLLSYFPDLTALQVKDILRRSTRKYSAVMVSVPGHDKEEAPLSQLSNTGGLVNAYEAVKQAERLQK